MWNINIYNVYIYRTADSYPWSILILNVSQLMAGLQSYHRVSCPILLSFVHDYQLRQELFMLWLTIRGPPDKFSIFTEPKVTVSQQLLWIQVQYQCNSHTIMTIMIIMLQDDQNHVHHHTGWFWSCYIDYPHTRWSGYIDYHPTGWSKSWLSSYRITQLLKSPIPAAAAAAPAPKSQKASSDDISGTKRGTIDPLVSKRPEKF